MLYSRQPVARTTLRDWAPPPPFHREDARRTPSLDLAYTRGLNVYPRTASVDEPTLPAFARQVEQRLPPPELQRGNIWDWTPPPPLWGRAFGLGVAGREAAETPRPEGRGVPRWALLCPASEAGCVGEPAAPSRAKRASMGKKGVDRVFLPFHPEAGAP